MLETNIIAVWADPFSLFMKRAFFLYHRGFASWASHIKLLSNFKEIREQKFHPPDKSRHAGHNSIAESGAKKYHEKIGTDFCEDSKFAFMFPAKIEI